ncbi:hypothetical protein SAMN06297358_2663 [Pedobacter xixiisoli]|uniref:PA14 domain-containing protein n=2 Tax=Pedobacter xixiisoli TaxID=1476464 RepID=A0A286A775_9SPHI|nr:hypothetical protein SAMN06297358_2663 [Pedobacter xixiisoli]
MIPKTYRIRFDALSLAVLLFVESTAPALTYGRSNIRTASNVVSTISPADDWVKNKQSKINPGATTFKKTDKNEQKFLSKQFLRPGGPEQPEYQSFSPSGADQLVNLFTGDFSYNIPLLDVDGYPINLSYSAGAGMDQEASWVGLGWTLNPGVINRSMRGIPDDFNGSEQVVQEYNQKPNWTVGTSAGFNYELFSVDLSNIAGQETGMGLSATLGVEYNNYSGYGAEFSIGPSFNIAKKIGFEVGMQYTGSSQGGASVGGYASISDGNKADDVVNKLSIGSSFNSRQGLQQVSVNLSQERRLTTNANNIAKPTKNKTARTVGREDIGTSLGSTFNFGMSSFVPQIPFSTTANSFTARFKLSADLVGNDPAGSFSGFFMKSKLASNTRTLSAYGYSHLEKGQGNINAMLDFNRENNSAFTKNTPALPIPFLMYDVYSISGQGVAGNYRMDRQDMGYVFDPSVTSSTNSYTLGGEVGLGATFKAGIDVGAVFAQGNSGVWMEGNDAAKKIRFNTKGGTFRDADEMAYDESDAEFQQIGGAKAAYFPLSNPKKLSGTLRTKAGDTYALHNSKSLRFRRNQPMSSLTVAEIKGGVGPTKLPPNAYASTTTGIDHHIGAFTVTKMDGSRYYYGLPAYSKIQRNVTFAVGEGKSSALAPDWDTRLVSYSGQDASVGNTRGLDNHFNAQTVPQYAHAYLLTALLSANYVDSDQIPGPSRDDLGGFVEFKYKKAQDYKWRNPVQESQAMHDRGLNTDPTDDRANYIYGEKELWYLDTIKTKNHVMICYTSDRRDAVAVTNEFGGLNASNAKMQKLDSLMLYSAADLRLNGAGAVPIKTVHFVYDYSLCRNYPGNLDAGSTDARQGGKLTLKSVYVTHEKSYKGERTPYTFYYDYFNPNYNSNNVDRWGTYKPNPTGLSGNELTDPLSNAEFPYSGFDKFNADAWASAWNLSSINLPTGGRMTISYEADDYGYVQHKRAKQMFKIIGVEGCSDGKCSISDDIKTNRKLYFEMMPGTTPDQYAAVDDVIYFKALMSMDEDNEHFDYVPGYAIIDEIGSQGANGYIKLRPGKLKDSENAVYNPIAISSVQFARNYLSRIIPPSSQANPQSEGANFLEIANSLIGAFASFGELFTGPNKPIWNKKIGTVLVTGKSWIRLNNPNFAKLGGGYRVREIRTYDAWDQMVHNGQESYYGQEYQYVFDGKSSGVASYEPQIGGEENVWRNYVANDISMTWAPDVRNYMETPFGEQFFPTPSVGYSKVLVKNLERDGVKRTATGYTVSEFYTAKDFPTITERTSVEVKPSKFNLNLLLYAKTEDLMAASQGFVVENNDMHGRPKSIEIFAEDQQAPYSSVKYIYQSKPETIEGIPANRLDNDVRIITPSGGIKTVTVGRTYEAVADFRENKSEMKSGNLGINLNYTMPFVLVPMILGANYSESKTEFRSAVFAKTIERKGILTRTVAVDYDSQIETSNLAYDSETGDVLLTSVNNAYRDTIYNFTYPAHWVYPGMGQAYKNLGFTSTTSNIFSDGYSNGFTGANLFEGDEVLVKSSSGQVLGWVTESGATGVRILKKDGTPLQGTFTYLKVLRSGKRNQQGTPVGTVTMLKNPLNTLGSNIFDKVLDAESIEFSDKWKAFCDCSPNGIQNPYVAGMKGNWTPSATYKHLSDRTQTFENNNTNLRKDGLMGSFLPFFRLSNGKWAINHQNWTYLAKVSELSPYGQAIEQADALGRFSATHMGYNQTLATASTANAMRRQSGFNGFEDYDFQNCPDGHFKFGSATNLSTDAHTGRHSIKVTQGSTIELQRQIVEACDDDPCDFSPYILSPTKVKVMQMDGVSMTYDVIHGDPTPVITEIPGGIELTFIHPYGYPFRVNVYLIKENGCSSLIPMISNGN